MTKTINKILALLMCPLMMILVGCKQNGDPSGSTLAFSDAGTLLLEEDTAARIFFNNLEYNFSSHEEYEALIEGISYIKTLGVNLSEQLSEYDNVLSEYASELETSTTKITKEETKIRIENDSQTFEVNMNEDKNNLKIEYIDSHGHYLYEVIKVGSNNYIAQVVNGISADDYTIYQFIFNGSSGKFAIKKASSFVSIYLVSLSTSNYPATSDVLFEI